MIQNTKFDIETEIQSKLLKLDAKIMSKGLFSTYFLYRGVKVRISDHQSLKHNEEKFGSCRVNIYTNRVKSADNAIKLINKKIDWIKRLENWQDILFPDGISDNFENVLINECRGSLKKYLKDNSLININRIIETYV
jgi:hypothetical protein